MSREYWKKGRRRRKQWTHFLPNRCNPSWDGRLADLFARLGYSCPKFKHSAIFTVPTSSVQKQIQKHRQTNSESPEELSCQEASGREPEERGINGRAFTWMKHPNTLILGMVSAPLSLTTRQPWTRQEPGRAAVLRCSWGFCSQPEMTTTFTGYTFPHWLYF